MDGFKEGLNSSVQLKLSFTLSMSILIVALIAGVFSFVFAFDEAHELQDDILRQVVQLIEQKQLSSNVTSVTHLKGNDAESQVIIQYVKANRPVNIDVEFPISEIMSDGLHTQEVKGKSFRMLVKTLSNGDCIVVAQPSSLRNEIAYDSALRTLMPFLILMPILLLIVAHLVRNMFQPISTLSKEIDQRAEHDLRPIESRHLPTEVRPFIIAINALFIRVEQSMETQRRFVADSAHELRTPMTAISLQAERLSEAEMSELARERLQILRQGVNRGRNLLDQLLALAKVQSNPEFMKTLLPIQNIYYQVLEDLMPLAEAKQIDIGIEGKLNVQIWANELDLTMIVKNLVDNAIRYTPIGGRVDLSIIQRDNRMILQIQDNGPGISVAERERVLDPFYRILGNDQIGSGLGLSIVNAISKRLDAKIYFDFTDKETQTGLKIQISIPL
ncbi:MULTISPECIES: ATP-binding protein [unclassified Acinetobacter]|nr:ATP-binding protein [Acinetobacter sp. TR11]WAU72336.1 ATP-binding protein [Acinetobacter sp. TR11]